MLIVGGPEQEAQKLKDRISKLNLTENITVLGRLGRLEIAEIYKNSDIGVLINSSSNQHSYEFTSPLKYFEYLYAVLGIVAIDFPSHRSLPYSKNISFFTNEDPRSFIEALKDASNKNTLNKDALERLSWENRAKKIIKFLQNIRLIIF